MHSRKSKRDGMWLATSYNQLLFLCWRLKTLHTEYLFSIIVYLVLVISSVVNGGRTTGMLHCCHTFLATATQALNAYIEATFCTIYLSWRSCSQLGSHHSVWNEEVTHGRYLSVYVHPQCWHSSAENAREREVWNAREKCDCTVSVLRTMTWGLSLWRQHELGVHCCTLVTGATYGFVSHDHHPSTVVDTSKSHARSLSAQLSYL